MVTVRALCLLCANSNQVKGEGREQHLQMLPLRPCWPGAAPETEQGLAKETCTVYTGPGLHSQHPKGEKNHCVGDILEGAGILEAPLSGDTPQAYGDTPPRYILFFS